MPIESEQSSRYEWLEPGTHEVRPGVYRIPLPLPTDGLRAVNVYALATDDDLVLIDAGWALDASRKQLEGSLALIDRDVRDITQFLVTHVHRDHYTQAVAVRREFGTRIALGHGERASVVALVDGAEREGQAQLDQLRTYGAADLIPSLLADGFGGPGDPGAWDPPDHWIHDGERRLVGDGSLLAVHTPGHTQGHVVFVDDGRQMLFAGDHILPHITPSIGFESKPGPLPLRDYFQSLRAVLELPDLRLLPAHGPVTESSHTRARELVAHHEERLRDCRDAVVAGASTAFETARALSWTRRERRFKDLDPTSQMLAVCETGAHLDLLVVQGLLSATSRSGVKHYSNVR